MRGIVDVCSPKPDVFSSCEDLLRREVLRVLMLMIGIASFIGNLVVIISRTLKGAFNVQSILITNLAMSDLLMAVYLLIIAGADLHYRGRYADFADIWKNSFLCSFAGCISTVSSECSVFILMLMSFDRAVNIAYPFRSKLLNRKRCKIIIAIAWIVVIVVSVLPTINYIIHFGDNYYGRQSVCLALPLTRSREPGWEYAIAVFIAFNLFSFIVIAVSYVTIYISIKRTAASANRSVQRAEDIRIASKLFLIVLTDFLCWFPIILMGVVSEIGGWMLPVEIYVWSATFIIPINSSVNPYLYTVVDMCKEIVSAIRSKNKRS